MKEFLPKLEFEKISILRKFVKCLFFLYNIGLLSDETE